MKIKAFTYSEQETKLEIKRVVFEDINLLIGISGAGKTQILNSLYQIVKIIKDDESIGELGEVSASLEFEIGKKYYIWNIRTHKEKDKYELVEENLKIEDEMYFNRKDSRLILDNQELPNISPEISIMKAYKSYGAINEISESVNNIVFPDLEKTLNASISPQMARRCEEDDSDMKYQPNNILLSKLYKAFRAENKIFEEIKEEFTSIFPTIEDMKFEYEEMEQRSISILIKNTYKIQKYTLYIKTRTGNWIKQNNISSGMMKTLLHLTYLKTFDEGSVLLIDEFENGLGVNCMEEITQNILGADNIQFILTSHHPYIINNIDMAYWKVVFRKDNVIYTKTAKELDLGKSKHDAFFALMNKLEFEGEI